jgi:hypothetical protein
MQTTTDFEKLVTMIRVYAEHVYNDAFATLVEQEAIKEDAYFESLIGYGEAFLEYVKAAKALARAKQIIDEEEA